MVSERSDHPVSGKLCVEYITRSVKRKSRKEKKLREFLSYFYAGNESLGKKAMATIKRGLGTLDLLVRADEFDEWWQGNGSLRKSKSDWCG